MKALVLLIIFSLLELGVFAQDTIQDDTTKVKIGNMTIIFNDGDDDFDFDMEEDTTKKQSKYIGLTGIFNIGMNGWLTPNNKTNFPSTYQSMSLNYARSRSVGFDLMIQGANLFNKRLFISPGIGFNWNNYFFEDNVTVSTGGDTTRFELDTLVNYDKYKLRATYIEIPLVIGTRIGNLDKSPLRIQAGVVGSFNLGSIVKQKYTFDDTKFKDKIKDDFNINPFKLDAIASISIGGFGIYGRYSFTSFFEKGKTQEVYPFSVGITIGSI